MTACVAYRFSHESTSRWIYVRIAATLLGRRGNLTVYRFRDKATLEWWIAVVSRAGELTETEAQDAHDLLGRGGRRGELPSHGIRALQERARTRGVLQRASIEHHPNGVSVRAEADKLSKEKLPDD